MESRPLGRGVVDQVDKINYRIAIKGIEKDFYYWLMPMQITGGLADWIEVGTKGEVTYMMTTHSGLPYFAPERKE